MIKKSLMYFAKRSHDVKTQILLATMYGLVDLFGVGGTLAILMKARKLSNGRKHKKAIAKVPQPNVTA